MPSLQKGCLQHQHETHSVTGWRGNCLDIQVIPFIANQLVLVECNLADSSPQVQYRKIIANDDGMRLDNYLLRELDGVPRSYVYRIIRSGEVRINSGRAKPASRIHEDDKVRIPPLKYTPKGDPGRPPDGLIEKVVSAIFIENDEFLVVNKPPGLPVHGGTGQRFGLIEVLRAARPDETFELAHRLDRDTSGCLLIARNRKTLNVLRNAMRDVRAEKSYLALLAGQWRGGEREVDTPLTRDAERGGERMVEVDASGKTAISRFSPREIFGKAQPEASLMDVKIITGRTHQIRVHAAHLGHPVAGDDKYGDRAFNKAIKAQGVSRTFLHAQHLLLPDMDNGTPLRIEAPLPQDLAQTLNRLRNA